MVVVDLLRYFGCPCYWEFASTLKYVKPKFDSAGVKLIAIGVGTPEEARILAERLPFPLDSLYANPYRKAYDALGLCSTTHTGVVMDNSFPYVFPPRLWESRPLMGTAQLCR